MADLLSLNDISTDDISTFYGKDLRVGLLRLDKIHPVISGNKWFKLRFYIEETIRQNKKGIITFGGAWSNHIVATAAACRMKGLLAVGIIRGEEPQQYSSTLLQAQGLGMQLVFVSREDYSNKHIPSQWQSRDYFIIDEGGYGKLGAAGASTILDYCSKDFTHVICAVGTGTMMSGLINATTNDQTVIGISVLKGHHELTSAVEQLTFKRENWEIIHDYSLGGYARHQPKLIQFMNQFHSATGVPSDFVYTGKLLFAINDLITKEFFTGGSRLLVIHSGGLQGNASLPKGTLIF